MDGWIDGPRGGRFGKIAGCFGFDPPEYAEAGHDAGQFVAAFGCAKGAVILDDVTGGDAV